MAERIFKVAHRKNQHSKQITCYFVTDAHDDKDIPNRAIAAEFPISQLYDDETQEARAKRFADYMNKLAEAARIAQEQTHLIDILSRP